MPWAWRWPSGWRLAAMRVGSMAHISRAVRLLDITRRLRERGWTVKELAEEGETRH